ncbi:MAG: hypothetical protein JWN95_395 [Frankiales bacterium]|nr:hypothetical protein [Frankiales bacterium]
MNRRMHVGVVATLRSHASARLADAERSDRRPVGDDSGFTLTESMVAISLLVIVMAASLVFFVTNLQTSTYLRSKQVATQLADDAMEQARAFDVRAMFAGRDKLSSDLQWGAGKANDKVKPFLDNSSEVYDPAAADGNGSVCSISSTTITPCLPTVPYAQIVSNRTYNVSTYIGGCRRLQTATDQNCVAADPRTVDGTTVIGYFRIVVAVTWQYKSCKTGDANGTCTYVSSELRNATTTDQVFNLNTGSNVNVASNAALSLTSPGNQSTTTGVPAWLQILYSGGTGNVTWTGLALPNGLQIDSTNGLVYGTPAASCSAGCPLSVRGVDALGTSSTISFSWTVNAIPSITTPVDGGTVNGVKGTAVNLPSTISGGTTPFTWSVTGLPAGLAFSSSANAITGTPTAAGTWTPTLTVTDFSGKSDTTTFNYVIALPPPPVITSATTAIGKVGTVANVPNTKTGGDGAITWSATNLPDGISINATTGAMTGTPLTIQVIPTTVTATDIDGRSDTEVVTWTISGTLQNLPGSTAKWCMNVLSSGTADGTNVVGAACGTGPNFYWSVKPSADKTLQATYGSVTKCLTYNSVSGVNKTVVTTCDASDSKQRWDISTVSDGSLRISNGSGSLKQCLGFASQSAATGTQFDLGSCADSLRRNSWKYGSS